MKTRKVLALILSAMLVIGLFAGCGESGESKDTKAVSIEEVKEESTAAVSEKSEAAPAEEKSEAAPAEEKSEPASEAKEAEAAPEAAEAPEEDVTAESLLNGYYDAAADIEKIAFNMKLNADIFMAAMGQESAVKMSMDVEFKTDGENSYMKGSMENESDGEKETSEVEQYIIQEDGKQVTYSYDADLESWSKYESDGATITKELIPVVNPSGLTLDDSGDQYVVSGPVDMGELMENAGETFSELFSGLVGAIDSGLAGAADLEFRFNKETKALESVTMDMASVLEDTFKAMLSGLFADSEAQLSEEDMASLFELKINSFELIVDDINIDDSIEIVLPDDAKGADKTEEPDDGELLPGVTDDSEELSIELADSFEFKEEYKNVFYNGHEYQVDKMTIADFLKDNKLELEEDYKDVVVEAGNSDFGMTYLNDDFDSITFFVRNTSDKDLPITECSLYCIEFSIANDPSIEFGVAGVKSGATIDDIIAVLGNPTYGYESDYYSTYSWQDEDWNSLTFGFSFESKTITSANVSLW